VAAHLHGLRVRADDSGHGGEVARRRGDLLRLHGARREARRRRGAETAPES